MDRRHYARQEAMGAIVMWIMVLTIVYIVGADFDLWPDVFGWL